MLWFLHAVGRLQTSWPGNSTSSVCNFKSTVWPRAKKMLCVEEINLSPQPIGDMPRSAKNLLDRMVNAAKPLGS